jgi:hypothetical protein
MMAKDTFTPDDITQADMDKIAEHIEIYINTLEEVMIIPQDMMKSHGERIEKAIKVSRKLIKKLRNGDKSVFKDEDDWNVIA